jgi:hypothetical protein
MEGKIIMRRIIDNLENRNDNYILPFFWQHGESDEVLIEELERILECGIRAVCVESRPHPDFLGDKWWHDLDLIMDFARKNDMKVWVLDDDKFPTGHANGAYKNNPNLAKVYLAERHVDVIGPARDQGILVEPFVGKNGKLIAVIACPKPDTESLNISLEGAMDITDKVHDGVAYFDVPDGFYRVFVLYTTRSGGGRADYINLIDHNSVRVLVDTVYEAHYTRYSQDFGGAFAGFFSDEPELGNTPGYDFTEMLGKRDVKLPWSDELDMLMRELWAADFKRFLPALWYEGGEKTADIRYEYMENVTRLVESCFSQQLGDWCRERNVGYIGHIIEDDNAHGRLGCSIGHIYRAQTGQSMSGIDVVLLQIMPGFTETYHQWIASDRDGEFFHFGLARLGASIAQLDPAKQGRAMCEIFGAYGWAEGIRLMKWLTDHMLVRGINTYVPHAFSPSFPDRDCPPHFYARGNNPQFRFFASLMRYMNLMCHLMNGGSSDTEIAVLYHADAEWSTRATMLFQKPVRKLMDRQIESTIVSADYLMKADIEAGRFAINNLSFHTLVVPACTYLPESICSIIKRIASAGVDVIFIDKVPDKFSCQSLEPDSYTICPLNHLADHIVTKHEVVFRTDHYVPYLRSSRYAHDDGNIYMFFNEHITDEVDVNLTISNESASELLLYDAEQNEIIGAKKWNGVLHLQLAPGQAKTYIATNDSSSLYLSDFDKTWTTGSDDFLLIEETTIDPGWQVLTADASSYPVFIHERVINRGDQYINMNGPEGLPRFTGTIRYQGLVEMKYKPEERLILTIPEAGDALEIYINKHLVRRFLNPPFSVDITDYVVDGPNEIWIDTTNTLVWQMHDGQSTHMQLEPSGLLAAPLLRRYSKNK